jgi:hypothetical protein
MNIENSLLKALFVWFLGTVLCLILSVLITAVGLLVSFLLMVHGYGKAAFCALVIGCSPWILIMVLNVYEEFRGWLFRRAQRKRGGV